MPRVRWYSACKTNQTRVYAGGPRRKQIVIYGKNGHAEVLGLVGQTTGKAIVIEKLDEARRLDFSKSIRLYSQTTKSLDEFWEIVEYIKEHISPDVTLSTTIPFAAKWPTVCPTCESLPHHTI